MQPLHPGLTCIPTLIANTYFLGDPGGRWAVVDTGWPGFAARLIEEAARRFGPKSRPEGIFLTHGHFDHAGNVRALADYWNVPVYAHRLEVPYLSGQSDYPPPDPTVGGAIATASRVLSYRGYDLGTRLRTLSADAALEAGAPETGDVPGMDGWRWLHTPGHTPGHVSFYHREDRVLLAGDAVATVDMDSYVALLVTWWQEIHTGSAPFICDWKQYGLSVRRIASLEPFVLACGHGIPIKGGGVSGELLAFARQFAPPPHGRYVREPAHTDEGGVEALPPKPRDPLPYWLGAALVGLAVSLALLPKRRR